MYRKSLYYIFCTSVFLVLINKTIGQQNLTTEVFTLSTCEPNIYSLVKKYGDSLIKRQVIKKLEVRSSRTNSMEITGINPLRYKYYINNEAITQFMEASPLTLSLSNFTNGEYLITAPEIKVPEIFKTDSISSKVKFKIREFQTKKSEIDDSLQSIDTRLSLLWTEVQNTKKDTANWRAYFFSQTSVKQLFSKQDQFRIQREKNLKEAQMYTGGLPLNNPMFAILVKYRNSKPGKFDQAIENIRDSQTDFSYLYLQHHYRFKTIDSLLVCMERDPELIREFHFHEKVRGCLGYYGFNWSETQIGSRYDYFDNVPNGLQDNIKDVRQQILEKKFQLYEEFVLNIATQIGVLVQNQFREYSSFNNQLENVNCVDKALLDTIERKKINLANTFGFIQETNAELQILVSYLDINTELYQNIAKKINNNYVFLLSYLKNLEYITRENSIQYTLPTHSNLKNIDLIRYTIKRDDKITKNSQTYNYDFWLKGGLKIDFSVGFYGTRLIDNVYNKVLLDTAGGMDKIRITKQDDGKANFAFGGMVNVIPRNGASWINIGGSLGVAYSSNQKLQLLAGLSLHMGKTERIILHAGLAMGTIKYIDISANDFKFFDKNLYPIERDKLHDVKESDRVYMLQSPDIKFSSYTIPTLEKFVIRTFFGVSYNLSKKSALQAVSGTGVTTFGNNLSTGVSY